MDRNNIDELFRNKLTGRHIPVNEADFAEAMKLMDKGKGGAWKWIVGSLVVVALAAAAYVLWPTGARKEMSEGNNTEQVSNAPQTGLSHEDNAHSEHEKMSDANDAVGNTATEHENQLFDKNNQADREEQNSKTRASSETPNSAANALSNNSNASIDSGNKPIAKNNKPNTLSSKVEKSKSATEKASSKKNKAMSSVVSGNNGSEKKNSGTEARSNNKRTAKAEENMATASVNSTSAESQRANNPVTTEDFNITSGSVKSATEASGDMIFGEAQPAPTIGMIAPRNFNPFALSRMGLRASNATLYMGKMGATSISPWSLQLRTNYSMPRVIYSGENPSENYLKNRKEQEEQGNQVGVELLAQYNLGRFFVGTGLGYTSWKESANYQTRVEYDTSFWEVQTLTRDTSFYHYFPSGGVIDSILVDSTITYTQIVNVVEKRDSLGPNVLATMQWRTISLPIRFGWQKKFTANDIVGVETGADLLYAVAQKGSYLSTKQDQLSSTSGFGSYRKFGLNGYAAIEYRRYLVTNRWFISIAPEVRYSLLSWNKDFGHRYFSPGLRLAIGMKF